MAKRMIFFLKVAFAIAFVFPVATHAQELDTVESFQLVHDGGEDFILSDHKDKKAVVVFFTSSNCVFATRYVDRMNALHEEFKDKEVSFVALNSNDANLSQRDDESLMRQYSPFKFPYLKDKTQEIARNFGATTNPEVFVLLPQGDKFFIVYQGAIDDNPFEKSVKEKYAHQTISGLLEGNLPTVQKAEGKGCEIRWTE